MNHPDPPQPDPNDRSPESPRAEDEHPRGPEVHFGQILSNVEGQIEQLHRVRNELDDHALSITERERGLAEREDPAGGPRDEALAAVAEKLETRIRDAETRYARLVDEQEAFDAEREQWLVRRQEAESKLREREEELAQQERDFAEEREQLAAIAARVAEERAQQVRDAQQGGARHEDLSSRCAELEQQLQAERERAEQAEAERAAAAQKLAEQDRPTDPAKVGTDVRVRAMKQKIQKLEALLAEKHPQLVAAPPPPDHQEQLDDMRRKAQRLSDVAEHLRRRHHRLRKVRNLMKDRKPRPVRTGPDPRRAAVAAEQYAQQVRRLESQRVALGEKTAALAKAERRMVRKWAATRAIVLVGWIVAVGAVAAASSWLAASGIVPPERAASVTIDARARDRGALGEEQAAKWRAWHTALVADDGFLDALMIRLDERQIETFPDKAAINRRLASDLTFAAVDDDSLMLTLSGTEPDEIVTLLDLVASTIVVESGERLRKRTADPWATLNGATATLNPTPLNDQRLPWAGGLFGGLYLVLMLLGVLIYSKLVRVKREFDADGTLFDEIKPLSDGAVQKVAVIPTGRP